MRRLVVAVLSTSLLLGACTDDDPTLDPDASPTESSPSPSPSPSPTVAETEPTDPPPTATEVSEAATEEHTSDAEGEEGEGAFSGDVDMQARLSGAAVVPGPGDEGGSGTFAGTVELQEASGELCYELRVRGLSTTVTAARILRGRPGEAGEVVIDLEAPVGGSSAACTTVDAIDLVDLLEQTDTHYVNVYTESHPDGAVRGQLESGD